MSVFYQEMPEVSLNESPALPLNSSKPADPILELPAEFTMRKFFKSFSKPKTFDKIKAFCNWCDNHPNPGENTRQLYEQISEFQFFEDIVFVAQQEAEVLALDFSNNRLVLGAGLANGFVVLVSAKTGAATNKYRADDIKVRDLILGEKNIYTCGDSGYIRIWTYEGEKVREIEGEGVPMRVLSVTGDEKYIAAGDESGNVKVHNLSDYEIVGSFRKGSAIADILFTPDGKELLVALVESNEIEKYGFPDLQANSIFSHEDRVIGMAISSNMEFLASISVDKVLKIWNYTTKTGSCLVEIDAICVGFAPKSNLLITGNRDNSINIWDTTGALKTKIQGHTGPVNDIIMSGHGHLLISGSSDNTVRGWTLERLKTVDVLQGLTVPPLALLTIPNNALAVSAGLEENIKVWNIDKSSLMAEISSGSQKGVRCLGINGDGTLLVSGNNDGSLSLFKIDLGQLIFNKSATVSKHKDSVIGVCFTRKGDLVVSMGADQSLFVSMAKDLRTSREISKYNGVGSGLALYPDDTRIVTGGKAGMIIVLEALTLMKLKELAGHKDEITVIRVTDSQIVSASKDTTIKIWNSQSGILIKTMTGHQKAVNCMEVSQDYHKIITGSEDMTVRIWNLELGTQTGIVSFSEPVRVLALETKETRIISDGLPKNNLRIQDINSIKTSRILGGYEEKVNCLVMKKDESILFTGDNKNNIRVWDMTTNEYHEIKAHSFGVNMLKLTPNETKLVSCGADNSAKIWDVQDARNIKQLKVLKNFSNIVNDAVIYEDGKRVSFASEDCSVRHFDLETYEYLDVNWRHDYSVNCLAVKSDEKIIISGSDDKKIVMVNYLKFEFVAELGTHDGTVNSLVVTEDNQRLLSGGGDQSIRVWDLKERKLIIVLRGHSTGTVYSLVLSSDMNKVFSGGSDDMIRLWDIRNYKHVGVLEGSGGAVRGLALSGDNLRIYSTGDDRAVRQWELNDSKFIKFNEGHYGDILRMDVSPDGKYLYTVGRDNIVIVWDLLNKKEKKKLKGHNWTVHGVSISSDGSKAVTCTYNSQIALWDLKKENYIWLIMTTAARKYVIFSHDDKEIVTACCDSMVRVHDVKNGNTLRTFEDGHSSNVFRVMLTPDDKKLISSGADRLAIIWDYRTCQKLKVLEAHTLGVDGLALITIKNELKIVTGSLDKTIKVWNLNSGVCEQTVEGFPTAITDIVTTDDNRRLIVGCQKSFHELDIANALKMVNSYENEDFKVVDIMITKDSKKFYVAGGIIVDIYNEINGKFVKESRLTEGFSKKVTKELISPNQQMLVYADGKDKVHVWDFHGNRIANYQSHRKEITGLIMAEDNNTIVSASLDGKLVLYILSNKSTQIEIKAHPSGVTAIALNKSQKTLISAGEDGKIRMWSYPGLEKLDELITYGDVVHSIVILSAEDKPELFLTGGSSKKLTLWTLRGDDRSSSTISILPDVVKNMVMTPDNNILLIYLANGMMQIWDTLNYSYVNEIPLEDNNMMTVPVFFPSKKNRIMLYFNKIIDTQTGQVIFNINTIRKMTSFFFDFDSNSFYYITNYFELHKLDLNCLQTTFHQYLKYDSLTTLNKEPEKFIKRASCTYPFFFSFLHLVSIFDTPDLFNVEVLESIYNGKVEISHFFMLDIFRNTPLDIILMNKNITLLNKFFGLFFNYFDKENTTFFQKVRFLGYQFRENFDILDIMSSIIGLCDGDMSIISKILESSFIPFAPSLYDNSLSYREMIFPLYIETQSVYVVDKEFINNGLNERFKVIDIMENNKNAEPVEQNKSLVKAKIIAIPCIGNINNEKTEKIFSALSDLEPNNDIFASKVLKMLAEHVWFEQIKGVFIFDFACFAFFFVLYNIVFIIIYPYRVDIYYSDDSVLPTLNAASIIIDLLLIIYGVYMLINELRQFWKYGFTDYFKSIWNYFDILLIPSLLATCLLDMVRITMINEISDEFKVGIKLVSAFAMFCFWFRFLSFSRAVTEMASMIRLIFTVISRTKYFVIFMALFILSLAATFYLMHNDTKDEIPSIWDTILVFFSSTIGDTSGITDYDLVETNLKDYFLIFSSFLFAIILLNLLVSIIGDIHGEIKESGEKTRLYELINILVDTNFSNTAKIYGFFRGSGNGKANYLIQLYNEKHEEKIVDVYEALERDIERKVREIVVNENAKVLKENQEKMEALFQSQFDKIKQYLEKKAEK